jgi:hypothetical protein
MKFSKSRNAPGGLANPPDFAGFGNPARAICDLLKLGNLRVPTCKLGMFRLLLSILAISGLGGY